MSKFAIAAIALAVISSVSGAAIPRATPPQGWETDILEPYDVYHARYVALYCSTQHSQPFFDQCCHPMLKSETLEKNRGPQCVPNSPAFTSAMKAEPGSSVTSPALSSPSSDGEDENCDDGDDDPTDVPSHTPSPKPTSTPKPTPTPTFTPTPHPSSTHSKSSSPPQSSPTSGSGGGQVFTGGVATFFYQEGTAGACGNYNSDDSKVAALQTNMYGDLNKQSSHCGSQIKVTNLDNGKTVIATVADACPTCMNTNSVDLSKGAFDEIAAEEVGEVPISWEFI